MVAQRRHCHNKMYINIKPSHSKTAWGHREQKQPWKNIVDSQQNSQTHHNTEKNPQQKKSNSQQNKLNSRQNNYWTKFNLICHLFDHFNGSDLIWQRLFGFLTFLVNSNVSLFWENIITWLPAPSWPDSSTGRALLWYHRGLGLNLVQAFFFYLITVLLLKYQCNWDNLCNFVFFFCLYFLSIFMTLTNILWL